MLIYRSSLTSQDDLAELRRKAVWNNTFFQDVFGNKKREKNERQSPIHQLLCESHVKDRVYTFTDSTVVSVYCPFKAANTFCGSSNPNRFSAP